MSCGLAVYRGEETPRELIADAEEQMYLDKSISPALMGNMVEMTIPGGRVKVSNLKALRNLVRAIDRRDSYTRFHSDHATQLAVELARNVALDADQTNAITIAGPIHDLGKIVVPDEVLRKPGPLSPDERRTMEEHPVIGAAITAAVTDTTLSSTSSAITTSASTAKATPAACAPSGSRCPRASSPLPTRTAP